MKEKLKRLLAHIDKLCGQPRSRFENPDYEPCGFDVAWAMQRLSWLHETYSRHIELIASLEKEADWLAGALAYCGEPDCGCFDENARNCPNPAIHGECLGDCQFCWREAARAAVKAASHA